MKFKKQNSNGGTQTCIARDCQSFVDSSNLTNEANTYKVTFEVELHTRQKNYAILATMLRKQSYLVKKKSSPSPGLECSYGNILIPQTEILVGVCQSGFSYVHIEIFMKEKVARRDVGNRASLVDRARMQRP